MQSQCAVSLAPETRNHSPLTTHWFPFTNRSLPTAKKKAQTRGETIEGSSSPSGVCARRRAGFVPHRQNRFRVPYVSLSRRYLQARPHRNEALSPYAPCVRYGRERRRLRSCHGWPKNVSGGGIREAGLFVAASGLSQTEYFEGGKRRGSVQRVCGFNKG